jgi:hypothetical protein
MSFKTGFEAAQSPEEVRFGPSDATQFSQGAALNPLIISRVRPPSLNNALTHGLFYLFTLFLGLLSHEQS